MNVDDNIFVGREFELGKLKEILKKASAGSLQICLVAGDPGDGKTTLIEHFAESAKHDNRRLEFAIGTCDVDTGENDIYDPFRDIFAQFTGIRAKDVESLVSAESEFGPRYLLRYTLEALRDFAPELIGTLIPGAALLSTLSKVMLSSADQVLQRRIAVAANEEQVKHDEICKKTVAFFEKRAKNETPLILILDDIQWIDPLSLDLLSHLIKDLQKAAILIILAYRKTELTAADESGKTKPVHALVDRIKQDYNSLQIDLRESRVNSGHEFVERFLIGNNCKVKTEFEDEFFRRTGARPIFAVELLRFLRDRSVLKQNLIGVWEDAESVSAWKDLPDKITRPEALVEERLGQLSNEQMETARIASIEGFEFTAQVIVLMTGMDERTVLHILSSELGKKHDLVREVSEERVGNQVISHFRFTNVWYQSYIYDSIGVGERRTYHAEVAQSLEHLYGDNAYQIAIHLARHYEIGMKLAKTVDYLIQVGSQQAKVQQFTSAIQTFERALSLARQEKYDPGIIDALYCLAVKVKIEQGGEADYIEAEKLLDECIPLARKQREPRQLMNALRGMGRIHRFSGWYSMAMAFYVESRNIAEQINDDKGIAAALTNMGVVEVSEKRFDMAKFYHEERLKIAEKTDDDEGRVAALINLGDCWWQMAGENPSESKNALEEANKNLAHAEQINQLLSNSSRLAGIKTLQARVRSDQRDFVAAARLIQESIVLAKQGELTGRIVANLEALAYLLMTIEPASQLLPVVIGCIAKNGSKAQHVGIQELKEKIPDRLRTDEFKAAEQRGNSAKPYDLLAEVTSTLEYIVLQAETGK